MNPIHVVVMILLCIFILARVKIPQPLHSFIGTVPGLILMLGLIFYLFTKSPLLGVLALIAGYEMLNFPTQPVYNQLEDHLPNDAPFTPTRQYQITLEETVVKTMVPMIQSQTPNHLNFKYSSDDTHQAASIRE